MKRLRVTLWIAVSLIGLCTSAFALEKGNVRMICTLDKAIYKPGEIAACTVDGVPEAAERLVLTLTHLQRKVITVTLPATGAQCTQNLLLPPDDFTGYLLCVDALNAQGTVLQTAFTAVDCSSNWTKFPRYGYVWDFTTDADAEEKLAQLTRYHLNGIQFYDWQYRHHQPVAPDTTSWTDWSGRVIDGNVLRRYLDVAHAHGMACMAYNMVYAANMTYPYDNSGVQSAWRLVKANGEDFTCDMDATRGDVGVLQYFNLLNTDWQRYIFAQEQKVFSTFAFDGWHSDTIGENGRMKTADGEPLGYDANGKSIHLVKDCYTQFLNAAKQAIGDKYLVFNPVGAQGIENVNISDVDALYTEFWAWDADSDGMPYVSYYSLHKAILKAAAQSGGKSLIVAAYVNYRNPSDTFNAPAVRLLDSVVFASGGARIELGNGDGMLSDEYFPADRNKRMDNALQRDVERMYDFMVAYENLLRDGQTPVERQVEIAGYPVSTDGRANTIWCFTKADAAHEVYQFINLLSTDAGWRDTEQTKAAPTPLADAQVKLYTDFNAKAVCLASPDSEDLSIRELPLIRGEDAHGGYIAFTMPGLEYWNMIFLR